MSVPGSAAILFVALALPRAAQSVRLNGDMPRGRVATGPFADTPDGLRVLYVSSAGGLPELYSVPRLGGASVRLGTADELGAARDFQLDERSDRVVLRTRTPADEDRLTSLAVGGGALVALVDDGRTIASYRIARGSGDVVLRARSGAGPEQLLSVAATGGALRTLSGAPVQGREVTSFEPSADGAHVVFLGDLLTDGRNELFSAPVDGSRPFVRLSPDLTGFPGRFEVRRFALAADAESAAFTVADTDLYVVPLAGGTPLLLDSATRIEDIAHFAFTPDGSTLVVLADYETRLRDELFRVPRDGSRAPERISPDLPPQAAVRAFALTPEGTHVVFTADVRAPGRLGLFEVELGGTLRELSTGLPADGALDGQFELVPGGKSALVRVSGGSASGWYALERETGRVTRLGELFAPEPSADGRWALFRRADALGRQSLLVAPLERAGPTRLLASLQSALEFVPSADGRAVLLRGDLQVFGAQQLYAASVEGGRAVRLDEDAPPGSGRAGVVQGFALSHDEKHALYLAAQEFSGLEHTYGVTTDGSQRWARLDPGLAMLAQVRSRPLLVLDETAFLFEADQGAGEQLFRAPLGPGSLVALTEPARNLLAFALDPTGSFALAYVDPDGSGRFQLHAAPLAGAPARRLDQPSIPGGGVRTLRTASDGRFAAYVADERTDEQFELWSAALASSAHFRLSHDLADAVDVGSYELAAASARIVYSVNEASGTGLYGVPLDGSAPARPFLAPVTGPATRFALSADGLTLYFTAPTAPGRLDVFRAPLAGGAAQNLSSASAGFATVAHLALASDGAHLLLRTGDALVGSLVSLPSSGGTPVDLGARPDVFFGVLSSADGRTVYFVRRETSAPLARLYSVPITGGPPLLLSGARSVGTGPFDTLAPLVRLQPQEDWLGFLDANGELYAAPTDALRPPQRVNESSHGVDIDFVLGRERIVYRAGKGADPFAFELYARPYASLGLARRR